MEFKNYKKKPVKVEATILDDKVWNDVYNEENHEVMINGFSLQAGLVNEPKIVGQDESGQHILDDDFVRCFFVNTLEDINKESLHRAEVGDYLIKGIQGEIYACKPDIFQDTYEEV